MKCLVLSGGNVRGAYQAGALAYMKPKPEHIVGTSIGAINALVYNYSGPSGLEKHWMSVESRNDFLSSGFWRLLQFKKPKGLYSTSKLRSQLKDILQEGTPGCTSYACVYDYKDGRVKYFNNKQQAYLDAVVASASEPFNMEPVGNWVDGGLNQQVPIKFAVEELGYMPEETFAILTKPISPDAAPSEYEHLIHGLEIATGLLASIPRGRPLKA